MTGDARSVLVLSMPPWRFATRTRKGAREYARSGLQVSFLAMQQVGRTSKRAEAGTAERDGVLIHHVAVTEPMTAGSTRARATNLAKSYLPAMWRMLSASVRRKTDVVHVTGVPLIPLALVHSMVHGSSLVLDINERPASVEASGSLFSVVSKFEPWLIRAAAGRARVVTVVAPGHARILRERFGIEQSLVVRNAPERQWRHGWQDLPAHRPLHVVTVGSIFPGRALEILIRAVRIVNSRDTLVRLSIVGVGAPEYVRSLATLIDSEGVADAVSLEGPVDSSAVSEAYTRGHVGLALYEAHDPGNDSLSNKILETVASGRPVLAGDLPENRDFVTTLDVGWLTPVNVDDVAAALQRIAALSDEELTALARHCAQVSAGALAWEFEFADVIAAVTGPEIKV